MAYTSVKVSANTGDYQQQMKSAATTMKQLTSEYKLAQAQAKLLGSAADSLKAKAENLTSKIEIQKNIVKLNTEQQEKLSLKLVDQKTKQEELKGKVEAAKKAYEESSKATGENSEQSKALKEELGKLEQEYKANESAIGKTETALTNQIIKTNNVKASLVEMKSELKSVNDKLKNMFADACDSAGKKMESFGKKMSVASAGIAAIGVASIASFKELDEGYDTIVKKTGATGEALEGLTQSANNLFGDMPEDMATVGEAIGEVNTRFHSTGEELESTSRQFIQFASINGTQVTQSVDQVDKIMKAWNVDSSQTGNLLGLLTAKAQETGISVDSLESYVLDNNAAFKEMGLSLPQAINLMAQFDANGVDSTTALAGLKKALQNATEEGKTMDEALQETIDSIKNASTETEAMQIATELFGKKGAAEMTKAIREGRIDLDSLSSSMTEYGSVVEDTYNGTLDPIDNATVAMNNAKLALSTLAQTGQTAAAPIITDLTNKIQGLTRWFTSLGEGQQQTIVKVGLVVAAIGPMAIGFGKVAQGISSTIKTGQQFVSGVSAIIAKITAKTAATAAGTAADTAATAAEGAHAAATTVAATTTGGMTAAQTALNVAMSLCPILLLVAGIGVIVAAGVTMYKNWDKIKELATKLWEKIKEVFGNIKEAIAGAFTKAKEAVSNKVNEMKDKIANSPIGQAATNTFSAVKNTVTMFMGAAVDTAKEKLNNMKTAYEENGGGIKGVVAAGWEGIKGYYTAGLTFVDKLSGGKLTEIKEQFNFKTNEIKQKVSDGWQNMKETVATTMQEWNANASSKLEALKNGFSTKVENIKSEWSTRFTSIKDTATNLMETAKENVAQKLENMKSAYNEKGGGMKGIVSATFTGIKDTMDLLMTTANTLTGGKLDSINSTFSTKLNAALSTVGTVMENIRAKFNEKMEAAKNVVSDAIDKIKEFFNFEWSLPHLKMPHFSISGSFNLKPPSVPSFGVEWYKSGGIMINPTVFGVNGARLMVGGEAGAEAILPLSEFYTKLNAMLDRKMQAINQNVNAIVQVHTYIDSEEVANVTTDKVSDNLAIATIKRR